MAKTVVVTGARGLVGGRFLQLLTQQDRWRVVGASRSASAVDAVPNVSFVRVDWQNQAEVERLCEQADAIVHLAAMNEPDGEANPEQALLDNGLATLRLVNAARAQNVKRFVYMSTAKVYGNQMQGEVTETTPVRPLNHYAITHHVAEDYVLAARARGHVEGVSFRLSNGVGAPVDPQTNCWMLITNSFCEQAVRDRRIVLSGTGIQWRNFIPLQDVAEALLFAIDAPNDKLDDGLFNLGGAASMRIIDMANLVADRCEALYGYRPDVQRQQPADGESAPSLNYACAKLERAGFRSHTSLSDEVDGILSMCHDVSA